MENSISIRYPDNYSNPISTIRKISCEQVLSNFQIYLDCVQTLSCWGYELTPCGTGCARNLVDLIFIKSYFKTIKNSFFLITCFVRRQVLLNDQNGRQIDGQTSVFQPMHYLESVEILVCLDYEPTPFQCFGCGQTPVYLAPALAEQVHLDICILKYLNNATV